MANFFRKLGFTRREDSSSDSEEEIRNEFTAPSDLPSDGLSDKSSIDERPQSVFSSQTRSSLTSGSRHTGFTEYTAGTGNTSNSLRSDSKKQRLRVVDVESGQGNNSQKTPSNFGELVVMLESLTSKMEVLDRQTSLESAPRISATLARLIYDYTAVFQSMTFEFDNEQLPDQSLSCVLRIVLGFSDVYLAESVHASARAHLLRALYHFARSLKLVGYEADRNDYSGFSSMTMLMDGNAMTVPQPRVFAVGSSSKPIPNEALLKTVLDKFCAGSVSIVEQEGAYAAPVLYGLSPRFSVATLCLGIPDMDHHHFESIVALRSELKSLHVFGRRDSIIPAAATTMPTSASSKTHIPLAEVKAPYRIPTDPTAPPMSISLATSNSAYASGTLGGFIYPQVSDPKLIDRNTYALTCGHVCLQEEENVGDDKASSEQNPKVEYPSPVLRRLFRKALAFQRDRFDPESPQRSVLEKGIARVDQQTHSLLGEVVWGERTVLGHQMSDTAVIKCEPSVKCQNWLGDDIELSQYDPTLLLDQLRVRCLVGKSRGLEVFKYGSTSKYTSGILSSIRMAYWANGTMQTSEFAVRTGDNSVFANGGDSGAWILSSTSNGLGVVGMLHSYDGQLKEFGLYTPMPNILTRLHDVTGIPWGVLGVPSETDPLRDEGELSD